MGGTLNSFKNNFCKTHVKVILIGEYGSGKTTALYRLKLNQVVNTIHTVGFNVEIIPIGDCNMEMWDFGGSVQMRKLWHHYFVDVDAVAFFIDLSQADQSYFKDSKDLLDMVMAYRDVQNSPFLVVCNKKDVGVISVDEALLQHDLNRYKNVNIHTISACSTSGEGLVQGLEWLGSEIMKRR